MDTKRIKVADPVHEVDENGQTKYAWTGFITSDDYWNRLKSGDARIRFLAEWNGTSNYKVREGMLKVLSLLLASNKETLAELFDIRLYEELSGTIGKMTQFQTKGDRS